MITPKRIKIDSDQIVDTLNMSIEISKLNCKICYCLLTNPKICYNKKCGQICCSDCTNAFAPNTPCPFCKLECEDMTYSSKNIDPNLLFVLKNLRVICKHINCNKKILTLEQYISHIESKRIEKSKCGCDTHWNLLKSCSQCTIIACRKCNKFHYNDWNNKCDKCFDKETEDNDKKNYDCGKCKKSGDYSPFMVGKCGMCNGIFCSKCLVLCPICKIDTCFDCIETCSSCYYKYTNSFQCKQCFKDKEKVNLFHHCKACNKRYCLNCVSTCNACNEILCCQEKHKCSSCEDNVCSKHLYSCEKCSDNKKVCLKKCTYECENCLQKSTVYCNEENHPTLSQGVISCSHQLCTKCIQKCSSCLFEQCQSCLKTKMFFCNICDNLLCFKCSNFCFRCYTSFCILHHCIICSSSMEECFTCYVKETKITCQLCEKSLDNCDDCLKKCLCSYRCYRKYTKAFKEEHMCPMFICSDCDNKRFIKKQKTLQSSKSHNHLNSPNPNNENDSESFNRSFDESYISNRYRKRLEHSDKVMIACEESCICQIY